MFVRVVSRPHTVNPTFFQKPKQLLSLFAGTDDGFEDFYVPRTTT
jgi:hypothetical protein